MVYFYYVHNNIKCFFFYGHLFIKGGYAMPGTIPALGTRGSLDNTPIFDETGKKPSDVDVQKTLFHKGELSFGVVLGFCTGYLIKKVGKLFALAVGAGFIFLQVKKKKKHNKIQYYL